MSSQERMHCGRLGSHEAHQWIGWLRVFDCSGRIATEGASVEKAVAEAEARTREAIAVGIEADVCCTTYTSWCARCVAKQEDAELARKGGKP